MDQRVVVIIESTPSGRVSALVGNLEKSGKLTVFKWHTCGDLFCWYEMTKCDELWDIFTANDIRARETTLEGVKEFQRGFVLGFNSK